MPDTIDTRITPETGDLYYVANSLVQNSNETSILANAPTITSQYPNEVTAHTHIMSDIIELISKIDSKSEFNHEHIISNVAGLADVLTTKATINHTHEISAITNLTQILDSKSSVADMQTRAAINHTHSISDISLLSARLSEFITHTAVNTLLDTKANVSDLSNKVTSTQLTAGLSTKANLSHMHSMDDISGLNSKLSSIDVNISNLNTRISNIPTTTTSGNVTTPANSIAPIISGIHGVGKSISVNTGSWTNTPTAYFYQLCKTDTNNITTIISSSNVYTPVAADAYTRIFVYVMAINNSGASVIKTASTSPIVPIPTFSIKPNITGVFAVGNNLTINFTSELYTTYTYMWYRNNVSINITSNNYTTVAADIGTRITCKVIATNIAGTAESTSDFVYIVDLPKNLYAPSIDSTNVSATNTVLASAGGWVYFPTFTYQWRLNGVNISGATSKLYTVKTTDVGSALSFTVVATNAKGSVTISSASVIVEAFKEIVDIQANPITKPHIGNRNTYNVGPGYDYDTPDLVPWGGLQAGDTVNIFYKPTEYKTKIGLRGVGTQSSPITVNGVTDLNGNRPIFDFSAAQTAAGCNLGNGLDVFNPDYPEYGESLGGIIIKRGPKDQKGVYQPSWIQIKNLQLQGARNGSTYKTWFYGGTQIYSSAAGLYAVVGEDFLFENLVITNNGFGIFTQSKDGALSETCKRVIIRNCKIYGNGVVDSFLEHGIYNQGISPIVEYCYLGKNRAGSTGSAYKSRAAGEIFRYNWVVSHARAMDFVHSEDSAEGVSAQSDYGVLHCYGNVIVNDDINGNSYAPIHFGGDNLGEDSATGPLKNPLLPYKNQMYFYNNTYYSNTDQSSSNFVYLFDLSLAGTESTPRTKVYAWNNVFHITGTAQHSWVRYAGDVNLLSNNVIYGDISDARYDATPSRYSVTKSASTVTSNPKFINAVTYDFNPASGSPLIDKPLETLTNIPSTYRNLPVKYMPRKGSNGADVRPINGPYIDIGAYELDPLLPLYNGGIVITGSNVPMNSLTVSNTGQWTVNGVISYQWYKNDAIINGATSSAYQIQYTDALSAIYCIITNTSGAKSSSAKSSIITIAEDPRKPINTVTPVITSTYYAAEVASITTGTWSNAPTSYTYAWYFTDGTTQTLIGNTASISLPKTAIGKTLFCNVTATNSIGVVMVKVTGSIVRRNTIYDPDITGTYNFSTDDGTLLSELDTSWAYGDSVDYEIYGGYLRVSQFRQSAGKAAYRNTTTPKQNVEIVLKQGWIGTVGIWLSGAPSSGASKIVVTITPTTYEIRGNGAWVAAGTYSFPTSVDCKFGLYNLGGGSWVIKANDVQVGSAYQLGDNTLLYSGLYINTTDNTKTLVDKFRDY